MTTASSYALPEGLPEPLHRVVTYWTDLRRGENEMPFADDVDLPALMSTYAGATLIDVFANPHRFRFGPVGPKLSQRYGEPIEGKFSDEISSRPPFQCLTPQAQVTVERRRPTFFIDHSGCSTILLPLWAEGHVASLIGAVSWA